MDFQCGRRRQGQLPARCGEVRCSLFCWYLNALKVLVGRAMQNGSRILIGLRATCFVKA